ncbi:hypothetical protein NDA11_002517 [Ustilago hordei]|uniref:Uncharacterized protein n=1 Tax=Ustilago hordei TaxID=120017 RepID=I2FRF4_USTHO|nr:hypothetical protein NDA15_003163 [Ustilago hordei]KAJ1575191.1 hypothetical protein NDA11_002517 [Ustilago hordei]KAJ1575630.1 hypothetical protein NDA12_000664 [Ustilago hordei]KAJ1598006.1 hypothetical protein NDA14_001762 [Ustilago hordei]UTT88046.1 hypothetical protein NDA17_003500 [Ustilago hordei]
MVELRAPGCHHVLFQGSSRLPVQAQPFGPAQSSISLIDASACNLRAFDSKLAIYEISFEADPTQSCHQFSVPFQSDIDRTLQKS